MALTLVEAAKYSNDILQQGIVETFVYDDPLLTRLKWKDILGNAHSYNRETTEDSADFLGVNETWSPTEQAITGYTVTTKILGSTAQIDDFLIKSRSNINDLKAEVLKGKAKAMKKAFGSHAIYGSATTNTKEFSGAHVLIADSTYNSILVDTSDTQTVVLSMTRVDQAIDMIKGFRPTLILSSKGLLRRVSVYLRSVGSAFPQEVDQFGIKCKMFGGIPWYGSDHVLDTELTSSGAFSASTGGYTTSIFVLSLEEKGLMGCQTGGTMEVLPWTPVAESNKIESRIRWYCALMMESLVSCAKIVGIDADGTVAA